MGRAVAYIRVSDEGGRGDDMMSPQIQMAAIRDHCDRRGHTIVEVLEDIDLTGRFWRRRQVEQAVKMIESHTADVIVVWKISRVARNRLDWNIAVDRVEVAGGRLESATEPFDTATSAGRFARGMLAELAAYESEVIGDGWTSAHRQRHERGLPVNGKVPFGWVRGKPPTPDPVTAPVVRDLYGRWLAGESFRRLALWLQPRFPTRTGVPWHPTVVRYLLDNPWHAGYVVYRGDVRRGAHEPIIGADLWEQYQAARRDSRRVGRHATSAYLLSGLVRCGVCGHAMTGHPGGGQPLYQCAHARAVAGHTHRGVSARWLEGVVMRRVAEVAAEVDAEEVAATPDEGPGLRLRIAELDRHLAVLTGHLVSGLVPESAYAAARDQIVADRGRLLAELQGCQDRAALALSGPEARSLLAEWPTFGLTRRQALLRRLVRVVRVWPGPGRRAEVELSPRS